MGPENFTRMLKPLGASLPDGSMPSNRIKSKLPKKKKTKGEMLRHHPKEKEERCFANIRSNHPIHLNYFWKIFLTKGEDYLIIFLHFEFNDSINLIIFTVSFGCRIKSIYTNNEMLEQKNIESHLGATFQCLRNNYVTIKAMISFSIFLVSLPGKNKKKGLQYLSWSQTNRRWTSAA